MSYYQPQPSSYNQRKHYCHHRATKQGIIHSGIPNPYIKQVPIIPFGNEQ